MRDPESDGPGAEYDHFAIPKEWCSPCVDESNRSRTEGAYRNRKEDHADFGCSRHQTQVDHEMAEDIREVARAILSVRIPVIPRGQTVRPYRPIS